MTFGMSARRITESMKLVARSLFCNTRRRDERGNSSGVIEGIDSRAVRPMSAEDRVRIMGLPQGREFKLNPELDEDVLQITLPKELHSKKSTEQTYIEIKNSIDEGILVYWLDYQGQEKLYCMIQPDSSYRQHTYVSHPWTFKRCSNKQYVLANGELIAFAAEPPKETKVVLEAPRMLSWTLKTHEKYPKGFKSKVRTLLLCHHRLVKLENSYREGKPENSKKYSTFVRLFALLPSDIIITIIKHLAPPLSDYPEVEIPQKIQEIDNDNIRA